MRKILRKLEVPCLAVVPLVLGLCAFFQVQQSGILTVLVALLCVLVFFASFEFSKLDLGQIMPTVVLSALGAAGRILFAAFGSVCPFSAIAIISGASFGRRCGFMVGALSALVSNLFLGQGPWTAWQMYSWGLIGYLAGVLTDCGAFKHRALLYVFGVASAFVYGFILNTWYLVGFMNPITFATALFVYGAGVLGDVAHAISTVVFLFLLYEPWQRKLRRIVSKYRLVASV